MFRRLLLIVPLLLGLVIGSAALAQDTTTIMTAEDPELGTIFTDPDGMTLYIFLSDTPNSGESTCYDKCEENWPIFTAEGDLSLPDGVPGELGSITRTDGTMQVTYNGWPLYYFVKDEAPGDTTGQDVGEVWYVAAPAEGDATPMAEHDETEASPVASPSAAMATVSTADSADLGTILTDGHGMTVYIFTKDTADSGESTCYDQCATNWPPLVSEGTPTLAEGVPGTLGTIERTDGTMQVTYNGMPLYYYAADKAAGDTNGQDVGDVWYVVNPSDTGITTP